MKNIAFVALGDHALQSHVKHFVGMRDVTIKGGYDPSGESFVRARQECGIDLSCYDSFEAITADDAVDGVVIGSPDRFHLPQLEACVAAGKHVLCEKPLCNTEEELPCLQQALDAAREQGLIVTSCHPRRFDPPYVWLKDNMEGLTQRFGKPMMLTMDFTYHKPSNDKLGLHGNSMLQDHFNHEVDYLHFLFGHNSFTTTKLLDEHDRYQASGMRDDGIGFNFGGTRRLDTRTYAETIHLRFERGDVHIDTYDSRRNYIYDHHKAEGSYEQIEDAGTTDYTRRFWNINRNWVDAMHGVTSNYLTDRDMMVNSRLSVILPRQQALRHEF